MFLKIPASILARLRARGGRCAVRVWIGVRDGIILPVVSVKHIRRDQEQPQIPVWRRKRALLADQRAIGMAARKFRPDLIWWIAVIGDPMQVWCRQTDRMGQRLVRKHQLIQCGFQPAFDHPIARRIVGKADRPATPLRNTGPRLGDAGASQAGQIKIGFIQK